MASCVVSFMGSDTAMRPAISLSIAMSTTVAPSSLNDSALS